MISGTEFTIEPPEMVEIASRGLAHTIVTSSEIAEIKAQCESERAMCLACEDGMVVVELRPFGEELELFIWIAVAFRHGAFARQEIALQAIAMDLEATTLAFQTRRRGWARRLGPQWQKRGRDEFVRAV